MQLLADYCKNHKASGDRAMMNIINRKFPGAKYLTPQSERLVDCLLATSELGMRDKRAGLARIPGIVHELCEAYAEWGFTVTKRQKEDLEDLCTEYYDIKYAQENLALWNDKYKALWAPKQGRAELPDIKSLTAQEQQHWYFITRAFEGLTGISCSYLNTVIGSELKLRPAAMLKDANGQTDATRVLSEACLHEAIRALNQWPVLDKNSTGDQIDAKWYACHAALAELFTNDLIAREPLHGRCCHDPVIDRLEASMANGQTFGEYIHRRLLRYKEELSG